MSVSPDGQSDPGHPDRRLGLVTAGAAVVVLVAVLAWSTRKDDVVAIPATTLTLPTSTTEPLSTTLTNPRDTLVDLVPGVTATLHALVGGSNRELIDLTADSEATFLPPDSRSLGFSTSFAFDASNALLAFRTLTEGSDDSYRLNVWSETASFRLEQTDVGPYQWHQTQPGRLAAITALAGRTALRTFTFQDNDSDSPDATTMIEADWDQSLTAWGDYGLVIHDFDPHLETDVTTLLDQTGKVVWQSQNMTVLDASPTHLLVLRRLSDQDGYGHVVIEPSDPRSGIRLDLPVAGPVTGSAWSPGGRLAVHYPTRGRHWILRIYDTNFTRSTEITLGTWRVWDLEWGPDNRFILMPGTNDAGRDVVVFYDTSSGDLSFVDFPDWVQWADLS